MRMRSRINICVMNIMNWLEDLKFQLVKLPNRHYVYRKNGRSKKEITVPKTIHTKAQARNYIKTHNLVKPPKIYPSVFNQNMNFAKGYVVSRTPDNIPDDCNMKSKLKTFEPIGKGKQGVVYLASFNSFMKNPFAIKIIPRDLSAARRRERQPADVEYDIQKEVNKVAPNGTVKARSIFRCKDFIEPSELNLESSGNMSSLDRSSQTVITMQWCDAGTLRRFIGKPAGPYLPDMVTEANIQNIIGSVLKTLKQIQSAYPEFRHNDLHLDNVFMDYNRSRPTPFIGDFGWARLLKTGTNPAVNTANGTARTSVYGIGKETDIRYDQHFFLNDLRDFLRHKKNPKLFPKTFAFLDMAVPVGYRGVSGQHVNDWRLKYQDPCPDLPSLDTLLHHPYIAKRPVIRASNLQNAKYKLKPIPKTRRPFRSINLMIAKSKLRKTKKSASPKKRLVTSANLKAVISKMKSKKRVRISPRNLRKTSRHLKPVKKIVIPSVILKNPKFEKLVEEIWKNSGAISGKNFENAWSQARSNAFEVVRKRMLYLPGSPFSPNANRKVTKKASPPKRVSPPKRAAPPPITVNMENAVRRFKERSRALNVKKPIVQVKPPPVPKPVPSNPVVNIKKSPGTGRLKIRAPNSGRMVYADGSTISVQYLKNLATRHGVDIKGLRSKTDIAERIFSSKTK